MRLMTKCPVCVTTHFNEILNDDFNINSPNNKRLTKILVNSKYHSSRIFLFDGLAKMDSYSDSRYKSCVDNHILIRNPHLEYPENKQDFDTKYMNRVDNLLWNNVNFSHIMSLARFIQEQIDYSETLLGYIVITIDDSDYFVNNTNRFYKVSICYFYSFTNGFPSSADNYKNDVTFDDFVFKTMTEPYCMSVSSFIPIISYKFFESNNVLNVDDETKNMLLDDSESTKITRYAYKYIIKYNEDKLKKQIENDKQNKIDYFNIDNEIDM